MYQRKYDFQPGTRISSSQIDEEFDNVVGAANTIEANLTSHKNNVNNPHGTTASQVGALAKAGGQMEGNIDMNGKDVTSVQFLDFKDSNADGKKWKLVEGGTSGNLEARQYDASNNVIKTVDFAEVVKANGKNEMILRNQVAVPVSAATLGSLNVTFAKAYAVAPTVYATTLSSTYFAAVTNITTTGFTLVVREYQAVSATTTVNCNWVAVGEV